MAKANPTILVVGATGRFAGLVVPALAGRGATVRGLVRDAALGSKARTNGAAEIAVGDLRDRASLDAATRGVDGAFYIAPVFQPDEARIGLDFVQAARDAGVKRIVFSSAIHPVISVLQNHADKVPVEEAIVSSGMEYTILHPTVFYQNMAGAWPAVLQTGVLAEPFSQTARLARVDYRDVAEVAAIAFVEDRLVDGTFELCADGGLNRDEVAATISEVVGRQIKAASPNFEAWLEMAKMKPDDGQKAMLAAMYAYYDRHGLSGNPLTLRAILGREPRSLRQFFADLAAGAPVTAA